MDDGTSASRLIIMAVLILLSGFFSATETAFSSLNRTKLRVLENQGNKRATATLKLLENFDTILSSVLIGNNIVNITLASVATVFFIQIFGDAGTTISTVIITVLVLIFGEVTPKSLAKEHAEKFALFVTPTVILLNRIMLPLNKLFGLWRMLVSKLVKSDSSDKAISDDELLSMLDEATDQGGIDSMESALIRNAIEFSDVKVGDILVPRTQIVAVHKDDSIEDIAEAFLESEFSRLPVYDENLDDIIGVIHYKDFISLKESAGGKLEDCIQPALFISAGKNIHDVLQTLQKNKRHIAIVADEYGGTMGIITMEDILEELVGEIFDESDEMPEMIQKLDERNYMINTSAEVDKVFAYFNIHEETEANTVSGWINERLNAIPKPGDGFSGKNYHVLVTEADSYRASEIKLNLKA